MQDVNNFPPAITMFLLNTIGRCKANPPVDWPHEVYSLIMREDLASQAKSPYTQIQSNNTESEYFIPNNSDYNIHI